MPRLPYPRRSRLAFPIVLLGVVVAVAALAFVAVGARAMVWGEGTILRDGDDSLVIGNDMAYFGPCAAGYAGAEVCLTFDAAGAPVLDGVLLSITDPDVALTWTILRWSADAIELDGNAGPGTTISIARLPGTWQIVGGVGAPLTTGGAASTVIEHAGTVRIVRVPSTTSSSPDASSGWSSTPGTPPPAAVAGAAAPASAASTPMGDLTPQVAIGVLIGAVGLVAPGPFVQRAILLGAGAFVATR